MKIFIDIGHPAHVHYLKNVIIPLRDIGHHFLITARDKEMTHALLRDLDIPFYDRGRGGKSLLGKLVYLIFTNFRMFKLIRHFKPGIVVSFASPYAAQTAWLSRIASLSITDTEHATLGNLAFIPFSTKIYTPLVFLNDFGPKHIRFDGVIEQAYLHPKYFAPSDDILAELGVTKDDRYIILRFISWEATHDRGQVGISDAKKVEIVEQFSKHGKVFISSEKALPPCLNEYLLPTPPNRIHEVLYFADLFFGESGTMSTEAALLGVPTVRMSSLAKYLGNFIELQEKYELLYFYENIEKAMSKAIDILRDEKSKEKWRQRSEKFIKDKIDVTEFIINEIKGQK